MADYSGDALSAYNDIKEAGGPIVFLHPVIEDVPDDPALPWQGSTTPPTETAHVAVFFPLNAIAGRDSNPFAESALIPAYLLTFPVEIGTNLRKENGEIVSVVNVIPLAPDGVTVILYTCEVNTWPGT